MTRLNRYRSAVMREANNLTTTREAQGNPEIKPSGAYFMEDISSRYEITCLKRLAGEVSEYIKHGIGDEVENKAMSEIIVTRYKKMKGATA